MATDEIADPGPEVADRILDDLEDLALKPTDVARQSRRLRAHIEALRAEVRDLEIRALEMREEGDE